MKKSLLFLSFCLLAQTGSGQGPARRSEAPQELRIPWNGFELFSYLAAKFPVKIVDDFSEVLDHPKGILIVLGNEAVPQLFRHNVEAWVRGGGALLVASDEKPDTTEEQTLARLTGYGWGKHFVKNVNRGGLEAITSQEFEGNQFVIRTDWSEPIPALQRLFPSGSERRRQVFLNKPGYLLPTKGSQNSHILGRLVVSSGVDKQGRELSTPPFSQPFGCIAYPNNKGVVIQLSDQDLFNNQMLETKDNVEFAAWCLETLCRQEIGAQEDPIPLMILVAGRVQAPFQLPAPPLPLPDLDPYTAASLAARALDELLPSWEGPDGPFSQFSQRLSANNYLQNIIGIIGFCLAAAGIYLLIRYRGGFRARETARNSALVWSKAGRPVNPRAATQKSLTDDLLGQMEEILKQRKIDFWEIPDLKWVEKSPGSDPRGARKFEQAKKEILGFVCRNRQSLQNTKPSQVAKIRGLLTRLSDQLDRGFVQSARPGASGVNQENQA